jgi:hypothetical protein
VNPLPAAIASTDDSDPVVFVEPKYADRFRQCILRAGFEPLVDSGLCGVCDLTAFRFDKEVDVQKIAGWFNDIIASSPQTEGISSRAVRSQLKYSCAPRESDLGRMAGCE